MKRQRGAEVKTSLGRKVNKGGRAKEGGEERPTSGRGREAR